MIIKISTMRKILGYLLLWAICVVASSLIVITCGYPVKEAFIMWSILWTVIGVFVLVVDYAIDLIYD